MKSEKYPEKCFLGGDTPKNLKRANEFEMLEMLNDEDKQKLLIINNLRLVIFIAKKFANDEDLVSVGTIGLIKAANTFDADKGAKFSTYASSCITNEILMYLRKNKKHVYTISFEEVVAQTPDGSTLTLNDVLFIDEVGYQRIEKEQEIANLKKLLGELPKRQKDILCMLFGIDYKKCTQKEVAGILGISQSYVSRIEKSALAKLKKMILEEEKA